MMISAYQTRVGEGTQFDAPLQMIDPEVGATLRISIEAPRNVWRERKLYMRLIACNAQGTTFLDRCIISRV